MVRMERLNLDRVIPFVEKLVETPCQDRTPPKQIEDPIHEDGLDEGCVKADGRKPSSSCRKKTKKLAACDPVCELLVLEDLIEVDHVEADRESQRGA